MPPRARLAHGLPPPAGYRRCSGRRCRISALAARRRLPPRPAPRRPQVQPRRRRPGLRAGALHPPGGSSSRSAPATPPRASPRPASAPRPIRSPDASLKEREARRAASENGRGDWLRAGGGGAEPPTS